MGYSYWFMWTDEDVVKLKAFHAEGMSFSEIATEIGGGVTRNACIGKARRLKLEGRRRDTPRGARRCPKAPKPATKLVPQLLVGGRHSTQSILSPHMVEPRLSSLSPDDIPIAQRKQLLELKAHHCRWPYGDPGTPSFFFCGAGNVLGSSYCPYHFNVSRGHSHPVSKADRLEIARGVVRAGREAA